MKKIIVFPIWLLTKSFRIILGCFGFDPMRYLPESIYRVFIWWDFKVDIWSCKGDGCVVDDHMEEIEYIVKCIDEGVRLQDIKPTKAT